MRRRHWFYWILFVGCLGLVVGVWIHRNADEPIPKMERVELNRSVHKKKHTQVLALLPLALPKRFTDTCTFTSTDVDDHGNPVVVPPEIPAEKLERIDALYDSLSPLEASRKELEVLTEGMDALSAAKYLKTLHGFYGDLSDAIREYAERALAENPDSFDALFIKSQLSSDDAEKEAGFRRLYEMNPHS